MTKTYGTTKLWEINIAQTSKEGISSISSQTWQGESSLGGNCECFEKQALVLSSSPWIRIPKHKTRILFQSFTK